MAFEQLMADSMKKQEKKKEKESNKENHKDKPGSHSHHPHLFGGGKHGGASTPDHTDPASHGAFGGTTGGTSTGAAP